MLFESLTGFRENEVDDVAAQFVFENDRITSVANGRTMQCGRFETPTLSELRERWNNVATKLGAIRAREVVAVIEDESGES